MSEYEKKITSYIGKKILCIKNYYFLKEGDFYKMNSYDSEKCKVAMRLDNKTFLHFEIETLLETFQLKTIYDVRKEKISKVLNG